jgi:hypothetical protein
LAVFTLLEHPGGTGPDGSLVLVELDVIRRYLWMLIVPTRQSIFHAVEPLGAVFDVRSLAGVTTVAGLVAVAWWLRASFALVSVGLLWFLLLLVPSSVLVALDRAEPMAEHRVYLASCGIFLALGVAADRLAAAAARPPLARWTLRLTLALLLASLGGRTVLRNMVWNDPIALWTEAADGAPGHWLPYVPLGEALHRDGRHEEAVAALTTAARLRPSEHGVYGKLGVCLVETGRLDAAAATFERLTAADPSSGEGWYGLGLVALARGDLEAARALIQQSLDRDPSSQAALRALEALAAYKEGIPLPVPD